MSGRNSDGPFIAWAVTLETLDDEIRGFENIARQAAEEEGRIGKVMWSIHGGGKQDFGPVLGFYTYDHD